MTGELFQSFAEQRRLTTEQSFVRNCLIMQIPQLLTKRSLSQLGCGMHASGVCHNAADRF